MNEQDIHQIVPILRQVITQYKVPIVTEYGKSGNPFYVLISTIISLRTKDQTTAQATQNLLNQADTPEAIASLPVKTIESLIYPAGFYRVKAENIKNTCQTLVDQYDSQVPDDLDELLKLKGVGRKTANLVITLGFNKPGICVDIHVHRIFNRLGYLSTKTADSTEMVLRKKLPEEYWIEINDLLVTYGQNLCFPVSPKCSACYIYNYCDRVGVTKSR